MAIKRLLLFFTGISLGLGSYAKEIYSNPKNHYIIKSNLKNDSEGTATQLNLEPLSPFIEIKSTSSVLSSKESALQILEPLALTITGAIDGVLPNALGKPTIYGWACAVSSPSSIWVHLYLTGPYPIGRHITSTLANVISEAGVASACGSTGSNYRFQIEITPEMQESFGGTQIYIHGISPDGGVNPLLYNSGRFSIPTINRVHVATYGAKGDGVTDDSAAIQSAIDALGSDGGEVIFPEGVFILGTANGNDWIGTYPNAQPIRSAITINKPNITIRGAMNNSVRKTVLKLKSRSKLRIISVSPKGTNFALRDMVLDGNKKNRAECNATCQNREWYDGDVVDTLFMNWLNHGIIVDNLEIKDGLEDAIGCWKCDTISIKNSLLHDNGTLNAGATGVSFSFATNGIIDGNTIDNNSTGIWAAFGFDGIIILNNTIVNNYKGAIALGGQAMADSSVRDQDQNVLINKNIIINNGIGGGYPAISIIDVNNGVISENTIQDNLVGVQFLSAPSSTWQMTKNNISNTNSKRVQKFGIKIENASIDLLMKNNTCKNNGRSLAEQIKIFNSNAGVNPDWFKANKLEFEKLF